MRQTFLSVSLVAMLAGCGGSGSNPVSGGQIGSDAANAANTSEGAVFADSDDLVLNNARYDPATDELFLNNLPFDGVDGRYVRVAGVTIGASGAGVYESLVTATTGQRQYFAIFQRSASDSVQTVAVATDDYIGSGFGGVAAQRLIGSGALPATGEFLYRGTYAATRVERDTAAGPGIGDLRFVEADMELEVDIGDFDVTGAVEGFIGTRRIYDMSGTQIGTNNGITLATAQIDTDTGTIESSTAIGFVTDPTTMITSGDQNGTWQGVFAGANGGEVGGIIELEGSDGDLTVTETGGFIAVQQ